jgi:hypothetical protein
MLDGQLQDAAPAAHSFQLQPRQIIMNGYAMIKVRRGLAKAS